MSSTWDEAGRLSAQHISAGARAVNSRAYSYRADGHLISLTDRLSGTRTFDFDQAGRVTAVHAQGWTERYAYDDAGNQTSASWPSRHPGSEATGPRAYTGTTINRAGDVRFEHDALGRVVQRQKTRLSRKPDTWRYEWDTENRLTSVTTPDGTRWRYRYDPLGRRSAKQRLAADGESVVEEIRFTWDGLTLCEQTSHQPDFPNTVALTWDHRDVVPVAQTERLLTADDRQEEIDRRFFAIATDLIGTPTELIDESGDIAWRSRTTLWGTTAWARDSSTYTPSASPASTTTPRPVSTTTTFATTTRRPAATPPPTPSASLLPRTPSRTWTTRTAGVTRWASCPSTRRRRRPNRPGKGPSRPRTTSSRELRETG